MENSPTDKQIENYISLFKGREDVFAVRWEKGQKSGYMPAYEIDWAGYQEHKKQGGNFKNFEKKTYKRFNKKAILEHLSGNMVVGVYPLLVNNSS